MAARAHQHSQHQQCWCSRYPVRVADVKKVTIGDAKNNIKTVVVAKGDRAADKSLDADTIQVRKAVVGLVRKGDYRQNEAALGHANVLSGPRAS